MNDSLDLFFQEHSSLVSEESPVWRPPCFPPPDDFYVTVDKDGKPLSRYGDDYWSFKAFGWEGFNFARKELSFENLSLVKRVTFFILYHPRLFPGSTNSVNRVFQLVAKLAQVCDRNCIKLSELSRFPALHKEAFDAFSNRHEKGSVAWLHKLLANKNDLGFVIADERTIAFFAAHCKEHEVRQHPFIPQRIWANQLNRLHQVLEDFWEHREKIKSAFDWSLDAYLHNQKCTKNQAWWSPFFSAEWGHTLGRTVSIGTFDQFLEEHGIFHLFEDVVYRPEMKDTRTTKYRLDDFTSYLNSVRNCAVLFVLNFSLQRRTEAISMRSDCFVIEKDERLGDIGLLVGETTKTQSDSDARWVVPLVAKKGVDVANFINFMRLARPPEDVRDEIRANPYLMTPATEPWGRKSPDLNKPHKLDYAQWLTRAQPNFFINTDTIITDEDWKLACSMTKGLSDRPEFGIGRPWSFSTHQLRRTTAVNLFASEKVSLNSVKWAMKHSSGWMSLYYGRNYTRLRLNDEATKAVILEHYRAIYRQLAEVVNDSVEHVQPHNKETIPLKTVNLLEANEERRMLQLIKKGQAGCRKTLLGFCTKPGACEYGGIESVAHCAGSDGKGICADARFTRKNASELQNLREKHEEKISTLEPHSPRYKALSAEVEAIKVYFHVISK
jgi:hypothetical protein